MGKRGGDTLAAQIADILNSTADFKSNIQSRGQRIVDQAAAPTLGLSALGLLLLGPQSAMSLLYASFGYHLRFAAPISVLTFLRMTSENGILVKLGSEAAMAAHSNCSPRWIRSSSTLLASNRKTGTLTEEIPSVGQLITLRQTQGTTFDGMSENELLTFAAAAEYYYAL